MIHKRAKRYLSTWEGVMRRRNANSRLVRDNFFGPDGLPAAAAADVDLFPRYSAQRNRNHNEKLDKTGA